MCKKFCKVKVHRPYCFLLTPVLCCLLFFIDKIIYIEIAKKENDSWFTFVSFASHLLHISVYNSNTFFSINYEIKNFFFIIDFSRVLGNKFSQNAILFSLTGTTISRPV